MPAPEFIDEVSRICSDWLNPVSKAVFDALGQPETPEQARVNIGAIDQSYVDAADAGLQSQIDDFIVASGLFYLDTLTLYVDPTGDAEPTDPVSGDPFDSLSSAITWVKARYFVRQLTLTLAAGSYTESDTLETPTTLETIYLDLSGAVTIDFGANYFYLHSRLVVGPGDIELTFSGTNTPMVCYEELYVEASATLTLTLVAPPVTTSPVLLLQGRGYIEAGGTLEVDADNATALVLRTNGVYFINLGTVDASGLAKDVVIGSTVGYAPFALGTWANSADPTWDNAIPDATAGYWSDPRTGIIQQFGFVTAGTGTSGSVTFPKTFVSNCRAVFTTSTVNTVPVSASSYLTTGFTWGKSSTSANFAWTAIGT